jgi:hypothetical protein
LVYELEKTVGGIKRMIVKIDPDDVELTLRIGGGELTLIDVDTGATFEIMFSESDMIYLKKRLSEWNVCEG